MKDKSRQTGRERKEAETCNGLGSLQRTGQVALPPGTPRQATFLRLASLGRLIKQEPGSEKTGVPSLSLINRYCALA